MNNKRSQRHVLRTLTLICFFHFSGLNNGYTYLAEASPLNARQSFSLVGQTFKDSIYLTGIRRFNSSLNQIHIKITGIPFQVQMWTARLAARTLRAFGSALRGAPVSLRSAQPANVPVVRPVSDLKGGEIQEKYLKQKETWNKSSDFWKPEKVSEKLGKEAFYLKQACNRSAATLSGVQIAFVRKILRSTLRHGPEDNESLFKTFQRLHQTPGPSRPGVFVWPGI